MMRGVGEIAQFNGMYYPDKRAVVDQEKEFTWREVNERINQLANALTSGDRIAILAYNSSEYIECGFATAKVGMAFVPLNFRLSLREIEFILRGAKIDFMDDESKSRREFRIRRFSYD